MYKVIIHSPLNHYLLRINQRKQSIIVYWTLCKTGDSSVSKQLLVLVTRWCQWESCKASESCEGDDHWQLTLIKWYLQFSLLIIMLFYLCCKLWKEILVWVVINHSHLQEIRVLHLSEKKCKIKNSPLLFTYQRMLSLCRDWWSVLELLTRSLHVKSYLYLIRTFESQWV